MWISPLMTTGIKWNPSDLGTLLSEADAWYRSRNALSKWVDWPFTTEKARVKHKRLYPQFQTCQGHRGGTITSCMSGLSK